MRNKARLCVVLICAVLPFSTTFCMEPKPESSAEKLADGNNAFAVDVYRNLAGATKGNMMFSPAGVSATMAIIQAGAKGETKEEVSEALHLRLENAELHKTWNAAILWMMRRSEGGNHSFLMANSLWVQDGFKVNEAYKAGAKRSYNADVSNADFVSNPRGVSAEVNEWVKKNTAGRITRLVTPDFVKNLRGLAAVNTVYFSGQWLEPFPQKLTVKAPFILPDGSSIEAEMMNRGGTFRYHEEDGFKMLGIQYSDARFSAVILLPDKADGLAKMEKELKWDELRGWIGKLQGDLEGTGFLKGKTVNVSIPRFSFSSAFDMTGTLKVLGVDKAFTADADFGGISEEKPFYLMAVLHKTFIRFDEKGTEAAAATFGGFGGGMMPDTEEVHTFKADHPFMFFIVENKTGMILFVGRVVDPRG